MEGFNQIIILNQGVQDFQYIPWTPQETRPRDYYRLGFGNQTPASYRV